MRRNFHIRPLLALAAGTITAGTLWGCAAARPDIQAIQAVDPAALQFTLGDRTASAPTPIALSWSTQEKSLVRDWLDGLGKGGTVSFVTYAPGPLTVSSPDFSANFLSDGTLVLNAKNASGSGWSQTVRECTAVDTAFFGLVTGKLKNTFQMSQKQIFQLSNYQTTKLPNPRNLP